MSAEAESPAVEGEWHIAMDFKQGCDVGVGLVRLGDALEEMDRHLNALPGLDAQGAADLRLVCDEIGSNVVRHSTADQPVRLEFSVWLEKGMACLRLSDTGFEFNPLAQAEEPYLGDDLEKRSIGGLGLFFIRTLFPDGRYRREDGRNVIEVMYPLS